MDNFGYSAPAGQANATGHRGRPAGPARSGDLTAERAGAASCLVLDHGQDLEVGPEPADLVRLVAYWSGLELPPDGPSDSRCAAQDGRRRRPHSRRPPERSRGRLVVPALLLPAGAGRRLDIYI
jgi:hypothetical protein